MASSPSHLVLIERIEQLLARQPVEVMEELARRYFTPSALARQRPAERSAAIHALAVGRLGTGRELAGEIDRKLSLYAGGGFRFERDRPPDDPRRALMHRVLVLNRGKVPSDRTLRYALAGLGGGQNSHAATAQNLRHPLSPEQARGRDEGATTVASHHRASRR